MRRTSGDRDWRRYASSGVGVEDWGPLDTAASRQAGRLALALAGCGRLIPIPSHGLARSASGSGFGSRSVRPSVSPMLVRTQHLPHSRSTGVDCPFAKLISVISRPGQVPGEGSGLFEPLARISPTGLSLGMKRRVCSVLVSLVRLCPVVSGRYGCLLRLRSLT